jgi:hypothetical protein
MPSHRVFVIVGLLLVVSWAILYFVIELATTASNRVWMLGAHAAVTIVLCAGIGALVIGLRKLR